MSYDPRYMGYDPFKELERQREAKISGLPVVKYEIHESRTWKNTYSPEGKLINRELMSPISIEVGTTVTPNLETKKEISKKLLLCH